VTRAPPLGGNPLNARHQARNSSATGGGIAAAGLSLVVFGGNNLFWDDIPRAISVSALIGGSMLLAIGLLLSRRAPADPQDQRRP
jgi:hypothetical protein